MPIINFRTAAGLQSKTLHQKNFFLILIELDEFLKAQTNLSWEHRLLGGRMLACVFMAFIQSQYYKLKAFERQAKGLSLQGQHGSYREILSGT